MRASAGHVTALDVDEALMSRIHKRCGWYLVPDASYPTLEAYIDASYAALAADMRAYQAEVAAAEAASAPPRGAQGRARRRTRARARPARARVQAGARLLTWVY